MHPGTMLTDAIRQWRTPQLPNGGRTVRPEGSALHLDTQAMHWPTPTAMDSEQAGGLGATGTTRGPSLHRAMDAWATPLGRDGRSGQGMQVREGAPALPEQVTQWATPRTEDGESCGNHPGKQDSLTGQTRLWSTPRAACNVTGSKTRLPFAEGGNTSKPSL